VTAGAGGWRDRVVAALSVVMCLACILWNVELPTRLGLAILAQQYMALQLGLALTIAFLIHDPRGRRKPRVGLVDGVIALACLATLGYAVVDFKWLLAEQFYRPWQITLIGTVVTLAVM